MKTPSMLLSTNILSLQDTLFRQTHEKETSKCYTTTTLSCFVIVTYYSKIYELNFFLSYCQFFN